MSLRLLLILKRWNKIFAFYDNILYIANYDYVYKYENKLITDLNFKTATFQSEILTLELSNDGIPYVASSDTTITVKSLSI